MPDKAASATPDPACHECDCRSGSSVCRTDSRSWIAHGPPRTAADERGTPGSASKTPKTPPCRCRVGDKWCSIHDACRETGPNSFAMKPAGHRAHARGQRIRYPDSCESFIVRLQHVPTRTVAFWTHLAQTIPAQTRLNRIENCWRVAVPVEVQAPRHGLHLLPVIAAVRLEQAAADLRQREMGGRRLGEEAIRLGAGMEALVGIAHQLEHASGRRAGAEEFLQAEDEGVMAVVELEQAVEAVGARVPSRLDLAGHLRGEHVLRKRMARGRAQIEFR